MNKIMVVGHPNSGLEAVEGLLTAHGMLRAAPSRRDGLTPQQITETLRQAHGCAPLEALDAGSDLRQIAVGAVWNGMALDLMLGNLDRPVWGWADSQSIFVLDYWRDVDPAIQFILVYDAPHTALTRIAADEAAGVSAEDVARRARQWSAYNAALLHFFHRHPQRCQLVHAQQVARAPEQLLQLLRARNDAPCFARVECPSGSDTPRRVDAGAVNADEPALAEFLAQALLRQDTPSLHLFDELQASASLPLAESDEPDECDALAAWLAMAGQQRRLGTQALHADEVRCRVDQLNDKLTGFADENRQLAERLRESQARHQAELTERAAACQALGEERDQLISQLHQVQQELERYYMEVGRLRQDGLRQAQEHVEALAQRKAAQQKEAENQAKQADERIDKLRQQLSNGQSRHQTELSERAAAYQVLGEERDQLLSQLHQVQEALERYYLENGRLKQAAPVQTPPAAAAQPLFGAAERVKSQLSYRLGNTMITSSRSVGGWLLMPFALSRVARQFRAEKAEREARKLPPIHQYRDAHMAEQVKGHLSYRLGHALVHNARSPVGWVSMPSALLRQVKEFRLQQRG